MGLYRLSASLEAHEQDVRALVSPDENTIVSASRDATIRVWRRGEDGGWSHTINYQSTGFINSLSFDQSAGLIVSGGADKLIVLTDPDLVLGEPKGTLIGHSANVCSLDYAYDLIISGSWDKTAIVWSQGQPLYHLKGHAASVWGVKILSPTEFLTCSADGTVKMWEEDKLISTVKSHTDVVRDLLLLKDGYASCSNDETIRIVRGSKETVLRGHESFVYSLALLPDGNIVSCGEDRTVRIWTPQGVCVQVLTLPSISVWDVTVQSNGDIVSGSSDGIVRVFTNDPARYASPELLREFNESVENSTISQQSMDNIEKEKLPGPEALQQPGDQEGKVIMIKTASGVVEAHQWTENKWTKIGEVVGSSSSGKKQEYLGKKWDYVFDVDIKDGEPPLKLPYNANENAYIAAQRFLADNDLPNTYTEEVVRFILQNTGGVSLSEEQPVPVANPYADREPVNTESSSTLLPQKAFVTFETFKIATLEKGLDRLNSQQEVKLSEEQVEEIKGALQTMNVKILMSYAEKIIGTWNTSGKLLGFDLLRVSIGKSEEFPDNLFEMIRLGFELIDQSSAITMMTYRCLCNIFSNKWWGEVVTGDETILSEIFALANLEKMVNSEKDTHSAAVATLFLNYSILYQKTKSAELYQALLELFSEVGSKVKSEEALYRLTVAYGTLTFPKKLPLPLWVKELKKYENQPRFAELLKELE
ncbi:unnamed protein product [Kuraishia capsulata CBS 1993]|uniref:Uncharacterized protein n=1 Tax=Kuraishia capsulata CBS 1993 TaxID=1382522 RepID=W6MWA8_9ASCO|nr:uncharacterized protein KUCA_T00003097001 [Kuraishia capsulata CBS 1993]CDK27120.1 unnamed protein product [Kuraishia capsulata CBS 1993]